MLNKVTEAISKSVINHLYKVLLQYLWLLLYGYDNENITINDRQMIKPLLTSLEEK